MAGPTPAGKGSRLSVRTKNIVRKAKQSGAITAKQAQAIRKNLRAPNKSLSAATTRKLVKGSGVPDARQVLKDQRARSGRRAATKGAGGVKPPVVGGMRSSKAKYKRS